MRWNVFAHVTHTAATPRYGALLCLNGAGITYSWWRRILAAGGAAPAYDKLNALAEAAPAGASGLTMLPFGNGAERMLGNQCPGASLHGIDFNRHGPGEVLRAAIEGVAFALADGLLAMREKGIPINTLRAGRANLFLSPIFRATLASAAGVRVELYETDGAGGAARGAGLGAGLFPDARAAMAGLESLGGEDADRSIQADVAAAFARWQAEKSR
jgi:xylulokinase